MFIVIPVPSSCWIITISIWKFPTFLLQTVIDRTRVAWAAWGFECQVLAPPPGGCSSLPPLTPRQLGDCILFLFYLILKVYQIYAKRSPEEVHSLLRSFGTDFVILEDSICYERRHQRGCRLRDLLDVANGHVSTLLLHLRDPSERVEIQDASQVVPFTLDHMWE